ATVFALPNRFLFCCLATLFRVTVAFDSPLFFMEKSKCSLDAEWAVFERQISNASLLAQLPTTSSAVPSRTDRQSICKPSSGSRSWHSLQSWGGPVNWPLEL